MANTRRSDTFDRPHCDVTRRYSLRLSATRTLQAFSTPLLLFTSSQPPLISFRAMVTAEFCPKHKGYLMDASHKKQYHCETVKCGQGKNTPELKRDDDGLFRCVADDCKSQFETYSQAYNHLNRMSPDHWAKRDAHVPSQKVSI